MDPHTCITHVNLGFPFLDAVYFLIIQLNFIHISNYVVVVGFRTEHVILFVVLKCMISSTKAMLMFCYSFRKHKYSDGTVLILRTATVCVYIRLIYLTSLSSCCASSHIT